MLVYLFVPVVLAGVFFFLNFFNKGTPSSAVVETNQPVVASDKRQKAPTKKPVKSKEAKKIAAKDVTIDTTLNVEEEVDIRQLHAVQTRRNASQAPKNEEPAKEEPKKVEKVVEEPVVVAQPVVEESSKKKKKKKTDGFQVVAKPELTGRPQKPKKQESEIAEENASDKKYTSKKGKKGDKKVVEKKDPNKSIYKQITPTTPTEQEKEENKEDKKDESAEENSSEENKTEEKPKRKQRDDKPREPRKPRRENVIVTNPYKSVDDFWSDEPVKVVPKAQPVVNNVVETAKKETKSPAKKIGKKPANNSSVVIVGSEVNPWASVEETAVENASEDFPKLGEQPKVKRVKKTAAKQQEEEEEVKNPHKRESETHFEVQYEAPYEKKAKLDDSEDQPQEEASEEEQQESS